MKNLLPIKKDLFPIIIIVIGCVLRIIFPGDMEWKYDEQFMYKTSHEFASKNTYPEVGMMSGGGMLNAGFSYYPFIWFSKITITPTQMMVCVALCNIFAILIFYFCIKKLQSHQHTLFLYGLASYSIQVLTVVFSRKIWIQDLLPLFISIIWLLYLNRKNNIAVFFLGIISMLMGQLHISGFFYAAGLFIAMILFKKLPIKNWLFLGLGILVGLISAIPWIKHLITHPSGLSSITHLLKFEYWLHAILDPLGINVFYSLGNSTKDYLQFNNSIFLPIIGACFICVVFIFSIILIIKKTKFQIKLNNTEFIFICCAFIIFPGILLTFAAIPVRTHYLIATFPFLAFLIIRIVFVHSKKMVQLFIICQLIITITFFTYIHRKKIINGDYGKTYNYQMHQKITP